jgi:hypothetical protein
MFTANLIRSLKSLAAATVVLLASATASFAGDIVEVSNPHPTLSWTLSDLIIYGANGEKQVVLKPNDPSDDIVIAPQGSKIFGPFPFDVVRYFVSTQVGDSEFESIVLKVKVLEPQPVAFFQSLSTQQPLVYVIDQSVYPPHPPLGTKFSFRNGINPMLPGTFMGIMPDFENGWVVGQYTGRGVVVYDQAVVTVIPVNGPNGGR